MQNLLMLLVFLVVLAPAPWAWATSSAELYTAKSYGYGRVESRVRFAAGDGVVSSVFLWKDGSEKAGAFWNELDFEKLGADCHLETNPIYGQPAANHSQSHASLLNLCGAFHTYTFEWTPGALVWLVDGVEIRREMGEAAQAFADNAKAGMRIHWNLWPGDESFGGNFNPAILPVHEFIDWVQFSAYQGGAFALTWHEDFNAATLPAGLLTANWSSPKNHSTHSPKNVNFIGGYAVLSLTADDALGPKGAIVEDAGATPGADGSITVPNDASGNMSTPNSPNESGDTAGGCSVSSSQGQRSPLGTFAVLALALLHARTRRRIRLFGITTQALRES